MINSREFIPACGNPLGKIANPLAEWPVPMNFGSNAGIQRIKKYLRIGSKGHLQRVHKYVGTVIHRPYTGNRDWYTSRSARSRLPKR